MLLSQTLETKTTKLLSNQMLKSKVGLEWIKCKEEPPHQLEAFLSVGSVA